MASKLVPLRLPQELEELVTKDATSEKKSLQSIILARLAASYGKKGFELPKRGAQTIYDHGKIRQMSSKGKSAAEIAEKTGMSVNRVYEVLAENES